MLLGIIGDAHGNDEGLVLCLEYLRAKKVDQIIYLGDAVGYFPRSIECCNALEQAGVICLMGNHEAMVRGDLPVPEGKEDILRLPQTWSALPQKWRKQVCAHGPQLELQLAGRRILCVHGSPDAPLTEYVRPDAAMDLTFNADVLLLGHTHVPFVARTQYGLIVNPGSCGLPRDRGDLLSCAVLDLETLETQVTRLPFSPSPHLLASAHHKVRHCLGRQTNTFFGEVGGTRL